MTIVEFGKHLEGYFGGNYTAIQMQEVKRWAEKREERVLDLVYRYCVINETTQYKVPPDVKALNRNLYEVFEAYPELRFESHNRQIAADAKYITDDAGFTEEELEENLARLNDIFRGVRR